MISAQEGKIRPMAQISPSGSFVPLVNLVGAATPNPPMTGAERRQNFINLPLPGDCIFANSPGFLSVCCAKIQGMKQLMAGGGVALIGMQLIPMLANLFTTP